jgi:hypothetical protein
MIGVPISPSCSWDFAAAKCLKMSTAVPTQSRLIARSGRKQAVIRIQYIAWCALTCFSVDSLHRRV